MMSYCRLLLSLSEQLNREDLRMVTCLYMIPDRVSEQGWPDVFQYLDDRGLIVWDRTDLLRTLLQDIHRKDLVHSHLQHYEKTLKKNASDEGKRFFTHSVIIPGRSKIHLHTCQFSVCSLSKIYLHGINQVKFLLWSAHPLVLPSRAVQDATMSGQSGGERRKGLVTLNRILLTLPKLAEPMRLE